MKTADLLSISPKKLDTMTEKELRKVVSTMRSTARKRYERIEKAGLSDYSPAVNLLKKRGKKGLLPPVKELDKTSLINEYKRYKSFLKSKTSTKKGAKVYVEKIREAARAVARPESFESDDDLLRFYSLYDSLQETSIATAFNYRYVEKVMAETLEDNPDKSDEDLLRIAEERLQRQYIKDNPSTDPTSSKYFL